MQWLTRQNIARFEKLIESETDPIKIALLEGLLRDERAKDPVVPRGGSAPDRTHSSLPPPLQRALMSADAITLVADSVICTDEDGRILLFNRAAEHSFGYSAAEVIGEHVNMLLPERHRTQHARHMASFALGEGAANRLMGGQREVWGRRKNGEEFPAEATVSRDLIDGKTILTVVHRDITERKDLEDQREAIAHELDHRTRNVLAVVSSLVSLSAKSATSVEEFARSLRERLDALARTQTFLARGPGQSLNLSELLLSELALYRSADGANVLIKGEPVALSPAAVQPLALAVHELATNSAKYGALSDPHGRVTVTYEGKSKGEDSLLEIEWRETGGPPVKPPSRQGFGTRFIEQVIKRTFRADVDVEYRPEGLVCRMSLPRTRVEQSANTPAAALSG